MLRLFIKFYLIILFPLFAVIFLPVLDPISTLVQKWETSVYLKEFKGFFYLFDLEFKDLPEKEWQTHVKQLNTHFGYQLALGSLAEDFFTDDERSRLYQGEIVFQSAEVDRVLKRILESEHTLIFDLEDTRDQDMDNIVRGPVYLLNKLLAGVPKSGWGKRLHELSFHSGVLVQVVVQDDLPPMVANQSRLKDGKAVYFEEGKDVFSIYAPSSRKDYLYRFGPVDEHDLNQKLNILNRLLPACLLGLGILALAWPLYVDIKRLRKAAVAFGQGDLQYRVQLGRATSLGTLATAFNGMAGRIKKLITSHRDLTNAISHELKTPVARLRFSLEMLQENNDETDRNRYFANIERDVGDLEMLIGELLDHAQFDRANATANFEQVEFGKWLQEIIAPYTDFPQEITIEFEQEMDAPCLVRLDKRCMARAIENLMNNALRFTRKTIRVSLNCLQDDVVLCVEDDGPGVTDENRERIFQPFVRIDNSRNRKSGGSGLGLAIVSQIAKLHDGSVWCEKSDLGGASFILRWPKE